MMHYKVISTAKITIINKKAIEYPQGFELLHTLPWREALGMKTNEPINKLDIIMAKATGLSRQKVHDWKWLERNLYLSVANSILTADIDGTLIETQSGVEIPKLQTLGYLSNKSRLERLFNIITCGFPFFYITNNAFKRQKPMALDPLIEKAQEANLLPALAGIGIFFDGGTRVSSIDNSANIIESSSYGKLSKINASDREKIESVLNLTILKYKNIGKKVTLSDYPGFTPDKIKTYSKGNRMFSIAPFPSWKYNEQKFGHKNPDKRSDFRSTVIKEIRQLVDGLTLSAEFTVEEGGGTTIDIKKKNSNKALAVKYLLNQFPSNAHLLFAGDEVYEGGGDYAILDYMMGLKPRDKHFDKISLFVLNQRSAPIPILLRNVHMGGFGEINSDFLLGSYLMAYNNMCAFHNFNHIGRRVDHVLSTIIGYKQDMGDSDNIDISWWNR